MLKSISAAWLLVMCIPAIAGEAEKMTSADLEADWKSYIGKPVSVGPCRLEANAAILQCTTETVNFFVDRKTMARDDLRFTLKICADGNDAAVCVVNLTGIVRAFGGEDEPILVNSAIDKDS